MSRIFLCTALTLLLSVPLPGFNFLTRLSFALDKSNLIKGKVVDADTKGAIEFANVLLFHQSDTIPVQLTASDAKGEFTFANLPADTYSVKVLFMGFTSFTTQPFTLSGKSTVFRLEAIPLEIESLALGEITVRVDVANPTYQLDKKTIYVENQLQGAGGSAADLLHKLPSVTQSPDGKITIHGNSNLLVFINNKPSSMKGSELLENTPAAEIRKIELITSPSAKYNASGSAGIINLITKKNSANGFTGNVQTGTDHLGGYSSDFLLNYKYRRISFFAGLDRNQRRNQGDVDYATDYLTDQSNFKQSGLQKSQRINTGFRAGMDYELTKSDKILVSGNAGTFETSNNGDWTTAQTLTFKKITVLNVAANDNFRTGNYAQTDVTYEHKFKAPNHAFSMAGLWNKLKYEDNYLNLINETGGKELMRQSTFLNKNSNNYQFNADYSAPTGKSGHLEIGYQLSANQVQEDYLSNLTNSILHVDTNQKTTFSEMIQAGYATWQFKLKRIELKAGLRAEKLDRELTTLENSYPLHRFDLYPSFNSSFKIDSTSQILLNYSRRTDQLTTIQLDPLLRWYDFYNVMLGNPGLINEITDKITFDYIVSFPHLTLVSELYFYNTANKIEVIRSLYNNGIIKNRYENTGSEKTAGIEINANWELNDWLTLNQKADFIESHLDVQLDPIAQKKSYRQWYTVTTADVTLSPTLTLEADFSYYGPAMTAQSNIDKCFLAGISFRKSFFNKKLTFTLTGRDVIGLYKKVEHIQGTDFNQMVSTRNQFPVRFSLSYKFNHFKRDERRIAKSPPTE